MAVTATTSALPDNSRAPASFLKPFDCSLVELAITFDLGAPKRFTRLWPFKQMTIMPMPKAAMCKYYRPVLRENDVRRPW
jgi:hypothetical protein